MMALYPAPDVDPETQPFWDATAQGRLLIKRCVACDAPHHPPRAFCPYCFGETRWEPASGEGVIYTFSIMRKSPRGPFAIGYVTLTEGISILTNFVDCDLETLAIGQPVKVRFAETDGGPPIPVFTPA